MSCVSWILVLVRSEERRPQYILSQTASVLRLFCKIEWLGEDNGKPIVGGSHAFQVLK